MSLVKTPSFFGIVHYASNRGSMTSLKIEGDRILFTQNLYIDKASKEAIVFFYLELINERQYIQQYDILRGISHGINDFDIIPEQNFTQIIYIL